MVQHPRQHGARSAEPARKSRTRRLLGVFLHQRQRAITHVTDWYTKYKDAGLQVIGVHRPEYAFEKVPANVASGAKDLGITYPIALDNQLTTETSTGRPNI